MAHHHLPTHTPPPLQSPALPASLPERPPQPTSSLPPPSASLPPKPSTNVTPNLPNHVEPQKSLTIPVPGSFIPIRNTALKPPKSSLKQFFPAFTEDEESASNTPQEQQAQTEVEVAGRDLEVTPTNNHLIDAPHFVPSSNQLPPPSPKQSSVSDHGGQKTSKEPTPVPQAEESCVAAQPSDAVAPPPPRPELYSIVGQVGEGTFGKVYKARNAITNTHVALKRIRMETEKDGFPVTAMREIKLLQSLRHDNVVRLFEMMVSSGSAYMVFEYMDHDLTGVLAQTQFQFSAAHLKSLCHQMFRGLAYLHHKGVIHRDIKGSNILINNLGELKLADFGLARFYQKRRKADYTNRVITLWYRPPELLFGATVYGPEVDIWSAGCIMLELFTKKPIFQGNDELSQLEAIYKVFGTPTLQRWSGFANLPWYEMVKPKDTISNRFRELFRKWLSPAAIDLADQLLDYDPAKRVTAAQAMDAPYFLTEEPMAEKPTSLATLEGEWHELETKRAKKKKRE
ncbi:kinase-like domain-containing protein [Lentinula edodes]|uniref:kinase-like domain-containing protein n=1 Tax=Lentinula edodes TaxID=5353 RepID=UPI001E8E07C7|nr:kinase-like domain-containing protein [Lentinula edodes]KAH7879871.1 kinase-like domain-containing protein [Lentinula edodes]